MLKLTFNQKVGFGFAVIISLLLVSGLSSLWNLYGISESTSQVNDNAVPVVKEANQTQIQLLKQAKLSSLAYNAETEAEIYEYRKNFEIGAEEFDYLFNELGKLAAENPEMNDLVKNAEENYDAYYQAVDEMFNAKVSVLDFEAKANVAAEDLAVAADDVAASIDEIAYSLPYDAPSEDQAVVEGTANQAVGLLQSIFKTIDETNSALKIDGLAETKENFAFSIRTVELNMDQVNHLLEKYNSIEMWDAYRESLTALSGVVEMEPSLSTLKIEQLSQATIAREKLDLAAERVNNAVKSLDETLKLADSNFVQLQSELSNTIDLGSKSAIGILIMLLVGATLNFNSMRLAIKRKMIDLAKLNGTGRKLAEAQSQDLALETVLHAMQEKMGVERGSVYLTNEKNEFEVKAFFPPKSVDADSKPATFNVGEGILGKAAETKKTIFVPNTSKDSSFVSKEGEAPQALLCVPLVDKDILIGVINLSGSVKDVKFADSDYEFVSSVARSLVTTIKNIRMREVIEEQNRNLEAKVEERTAALRQKNNDIANMMANMHQGLFTITPGGLIHPEYSAYLEDIFETDRVANRNFADLMFENTNLTSDAIDQATTGVDAIVGEDEMMFDFNSHCLPTEMAITLEDGRQKILEMDWDPIKSDDIVDKLMVTVRDVTELKALELEAAAQRQELEIIGEILAVDAAKFSEFLDTSNEFVATCRELIEKTQEKDLDVVADLFRNMHTVKGNARTYGLSAITDKVHQVESTYDDLRKDESVQWNQAQLLEELQAADEVITQYGYMFKDKLGRDAEAAGGISLDLDRVSNLLHDIQKLTQSDLAPEVQKVVSEAYSTLIEVDSKPISSVITDVIDSVKSLAHDLEKPEPIIAIDDNDVFIQADVHSTLNNIFMHVFRNALDHGIEAPQDRLQKGKDAAGTISLKVEPRDGYAALGVRDDGRGIALTKIYEKAVENGVFGADEPRPAAQTIANLIFDSGFSTAEAVTNISGRGVGMDAVKNFLESKGGSIEVVLDAGDEADDFRTFTTVITLPDTCYSAMPAFAKTA